MFRRISDYEESHVCTHGALSVELHYVHGIGIIIIVRIAL